MLRTTVRIDDELLTEAKAYAARHHRSLNSVMEEALRRMLRTALELQERPPVTLTTAPGGGLQPGVDLSPAGIKQFLEDDDIRHFREVAAREAD